MARDERAWKLARGPSKGKTALRKPRGSSWLSGLDSGDELDYGRGPRSPGDFRGGDSRVEPSRRSFGTCSPWAVSKGRRKLTAMRPWIWAHTVEHRPPGPPCLWPGPAPRPSRGRGLAHGARRRRWSERAIRRHPRPARETGTFTHAGLKVLLTGTFQTGFSGAERKTMFRSRPPSTRTRRTHDPGTAPRPAGEGSLGCRGGPKKLGGRNVPLQFPQRNGFYEVVLEFLPRRADPGTRSTGRRGLGRHGGRHLGSGKKAAGTREGPKTWAWVTGTSTWLTMNGWCSYSSGPVRGE